jgi:hypothetical protein
MFSSVIWFDYELGEKTYVATLSVMVTRLAIELRSLHSLRRLSLLCHRHPSEKAPRGGVLPRGQYSFNQKASLIDDCADYGTNASCCTLCADDDEYA